MMEVNKDEAERCIEYAERFILVGKKDKAEEYLLKAERLFPTQKAKDLLEQLKTFQPQAEQEGEPRKRHVPKKESDEQSQHKEHQQQSKSSASDKEFNKEHLEAVKRIKKCKGHYEILGVSKEATENDIRKAYRKLALQLHPDKNKCPGAEEAFKAIDRAVNILTDPKKRTLYDFIVSYIERQQPAQRPTHEEHSNMNSGGGLHYQNGTENRSQNREKQAIRYTVFLWVLPILLIVLAVMSFFSFTSDPIYSLHKSSTYPVQRKTRNLKVPYFVKEDFSLDYRGRRKLEKSIEEEYVTRLEHSCLTEKNNREEFEIQARINKDRDLLQKARKMSMRSCDKLRDIKAQAG